MAYEHLNHAFMILKNVKNITVLHWYTYLTLYHMFENEVFIELKHHTKHSSPVLYPSIAFSCFQLNE